MMHFVRTFSVVRARRKAYCYQRGLKLYKKLYTSKTLLKMAGGEMHTPHSTPLDPTLAISYRNLQKSLAYFSHLAPLTSFFFTKQHSQKGGMAQCSPPPKYALGLKHA